MKLGRQLGNRFGVVLAAIAVSAVVIYAEVSQMTEIHGEISTL